MWKFKNFIAIHILREIDFSDFKSLKIAILITSWSLLYFTKLIASETVKTSKLISRKIGAAEKLSIFHTVCYT